MDSSYEQELTVVFEAIQVATAISRTVLQFLHPSSDAGPAPAAPADPELAALRTSLQVLKDDNTFVTAADLAIQAVLLRVLSVAFPTHRLVAEESAAQLRADPALLAIVTSLAVTHSRASAFVWAHGGGDVAAHVMRLFDRAAAPQPATSALDPTWVIDPIDGTAAFMRGEHYAINVAHLCDSRQILSVVALPLLSPTTTTPITDADTAPASGGTLVFAVRGYGAHVAPLGSPSESRALPRHADAVPLAGLASVTCYGTLKSGYDGMHAAVAAKLAMPFPGTNLLGWVPRWAALALGLGNTTVWVYRRRDRYAKVWDHAGAMLLFEEVGGMVTDVDGRDIDLSPGRLLNANFGFVAAPRSVHHHVLAAVKTLLQEQGRAGFPAK
ncbi:hypothetical protein B0H67DRAFT_264896 [Lasiosphaeris hirsuta]|uniref:Uncharacterized protein n=1 Tax=Lasiosphaeris hirsuta TaxID=260670 RepID=A0AA40DP29_9PEZI|nr:hypothetical protein B0H67DRAFT_264896 [Lasiosphaeris hirsuta]